MESSRGWLAYRWELLILLWCTFFLHQADRQIYNNLLPLIQADLQLSDVQVGLVASVFTATFGIAVPLGGYLGDILRRKWLVLGSLLVWSSATLLTGLSGGLLGLILFRGLATGGGEAFYFPAATSLVAQHHPQTRAMALAIHQTAIYVGIVASFLAGYLGEVYGWRQAFYVFGGLGIVMGAVLLVRLRNTPQVDQQANPHAHQKAEPGPSIGETVRAIFSKPTALLLAAALAGHVFVNVGYLTWTPTFLHEQFGMSVTAAGFAALAYHHALAFIGVLLAGRLSDRWALRRRRSRLELQSLGLLLGSPFVLWMGQASSVMACCVALGLFGLFRGVYDSNIWASLFEVIEPRYRSSATGVLLCAAFLAGALSPILLGWTKASLGLAAGISALSVVYAGAGVMILIAVLTTFARDCCPASDD